MAKFAFKHEIAIILMKLGKFGLVKFVFKIAETIEAINAVP